MADDEEEVQTAPEEPDPELSNTVELNDEQGGIKLSG